MDKNSRSSGYVETPKGKTPKEERNSGEGGRSSGYVDTGVPDIPPEERNSSSGRSDGYPTQREK